MNIPNKDYLLKVDEAGNEYYSLKLSDDDETVSDLLTIQTTFGEKFDKVNVKQEILNKYLKELPFAIIT